MGCDGRIRGLFASKTGIAANAGDEVGFGSIGVVHSVFPTREIAPLTYLNAPCVHWRLPPYCLYLIATLEILMPENRREGRKLDPRTVIKILY